MIERDYLEAVPAYYAEARGQSVPFIVSLLFLDENRNPRITPAVETSIDATIDVTGRTGLATAIISDDGTVERQARLYIERAFAIPEAIVLFLCQRAETAERLMQFLNTAYRLSLVQRPAPKTGSVDSGV